ncbi:hypothetical protein, partial [Escherichia coli]|uniref:hypothetical protein n=2 Tax=Enterobacterales TaxID=91347 RepID=UPI0039C9A78D
SPPCLTSLSLIKARLTACFLHCLTPCEEQGSHSPPKPIGGQFSQYAENAQRECGGGMHGVHPLFWLRKIRTRVIDSPATRLPVT